MTLNTVWDISTTIGLILQTGILFDGWVSIEALRLSGRNGAARMVAIHHLKADILRLVIMVILLLIGSHLPLHILDWWIAWSLIIVIWIAIAIAALTMYDRRQLLRMV